MQEISERIGVSTKTIQREVKRGSVELLNSDLTVKKEYVAEFAHQKYRDKKIFLKLRKKHLPYNKKYERHEELEKRIKKNGGRSIEEMGTAYFYAHSYCSYERGSNENNNRFIRRFIRKGTDIGKCSKACIKKIEKYINTYPRKQFGGKSADEVYKELFT